MSTPRSSPQPLLIKALKDPKTAMQVGRALLQNFTNQQWDRFEHKTPIQHLISERTNFIDQLLRRVWKHYIPSNSQLCLVAVGGYGRGELHPFSDIDILIITPSQQIPESEYRAIETFITYLWDIGLQVGHAIRTQEDCYSIGRSDLSTATNYIESRWLIGHYEAFESLKQLLKHPNFWPSNAFFLAKIEEQTQRYNKANDAIAQLEPNIKESPGGLRDIHTIAWIAKRHFGANSLQQLVSVGFLSVDEYSQLENAMRFQWRVRFILHSITKRKEERLLFDHQKQIAQLLGYQDSTGKLAVEAFMQDYYRNARTIQRLNSLLLQHFQESILGTENVQPQTIAPHITLQQGYLKLDKESTLIAQPLLFITLFYWQAKLGAKGIHASTQRWMQSYAHLINASFCQQIDTWQTFRKLLQLPRNVSQALIHMHRQGILGRLIPAFHRITGLMQFDLFHAYTVDEHSLMVVRNLRRFMHASPKTQNSFPLACQIAQHIDAPDILLLAGFFHDIGKGRGGQHEILGAEDARAFGAQAGLNTSETQLLTWLVEHHLIMSHTAQKKDLTDPEVIAQFAQVITTQQNLDYLYLLTVADICATSPVVWNDWKDNLLRNLYHRTQSHLNTQQQQTNRMTQLLEQMTPETQIKVKPIWQKLSHTHYQHQENAALSEQARFLANIHDLPHLCVQDSSITGVSTLMIYTQNQPDAWLKTTAACDAMQLSIIDAHVYTTQDQHLFMIINLIKPQHTNTEEQAYWLNILRDCLSQANCNHILTPVARTSSRQKQHAFAITNRVHIKTNMQNNSLELHLYTKDQPGLLLRCAQLFYQHHLMITAAKISTAGIKVEDVFYLSASTADQAISEQQLDQLKADLLSCLQI